MIRLVPVEHITSGTHVLGRNAGTVTRTTRRGDEVVLTFADHQLVKHAGDEMAVKEEG